MSKQLEVQLYIAKQYPLYGVRLDKTNMEAAALACGGTLFSYRTNKWAGEPYIRLATRHGHVKVRSGMWLIEQNGKWASLTDHNFHRKYEMPEGKYVKVITVQEGGLPTAVERPSGLQAELVEVDGVPFTHIKHVRPATPSRSEVEDYQEVLKDRMSTRQEIRKDLQEALNSGDQQEIEDQVARARKLMGL